MIPGQLGPMRRRFALQVIFDLHHVHDRNAFGDGHDQSQPASTASMMASAANGGRHEDHAAVGAGFSNRLFHRVEHRHVVHLLAALARSHAGHHLGAVGDALSGVKLPSLPVIP